MAGLKIVFAFDRGILGREKGFCCWKGHFYRHRVFLHVVIVVSTLFFSLVKITENNLVPIAPRPSHHTRERFPLLATKILQSKPEINLQNGRFFITVHEFEARVNEICFQLWKIQVFPKFLADNYSKKKERHFVSGDLHMFAEFMSIFLTKEFVDPKGMFRKICRQQPFEFLLMFDLCRE